MILVECNPDEYLIKCLGIPRKMIRHEGGIGNVVTKVGRIGNSIGIIDEDPGKSKPRDLKNYLPYDDHGSISLLVREKEYDKKIIRISPDLEGWLIKRGNESTLPPRDFGLPDDPIEMHDIPHIEKLTEFQDYLAELIAAAEEIVTLKGWLTDAIR